MTPFVPEEPRVLSKQNTVKPKLRVERQTGNIKGPWTPYLVDRKHETQLGRPFTLPS